MCRRKIYSESLRHPSFPDFSFRLQSLFQPNLTEHSYLAIYIYTTVCKYLFSRPTCAVDPIENEEDRKKAIFNINSLLEKADVAYQKLVKNKPDMEKWLERISESGTLIEETGGGAAQAGAVAPGSQVNQFIQVLISVPIIFRVRMIRMKIICPLFTAIGTEVLR